MKIIFDSLYRLNFDEKNPILIRNHPLFTDLLILQFHEKCHSRVNHYIKY